MNFQQLEYALAIHEHQHFGKAAESCHVTQATLSAMIKKLETELNLVLFDRSHHPVQTTEAGLQFLKLAQKILMNKNEMYSLGKEKKQELTGQLTLGIIPTIAHSLLPIIVPPLLEQNPNLQLNIREITTEQIVEQLKMDQIDVGILATPLEENVLEESILYYEPMMIYGIKDENKQYLSTDEIKNRKIWLLEEGHCFRKQAITICDIQEKSMEKDRLHFEGSSFGTLLNVTDAFGGCTLVPELYFQEMPLARKQMTKYFQTPIPVREISLVSYRIHAMQQTIDYLTDFIPRLVKDRLTTSNYKKTDLEIIGI